MATTQSMAQYLRSISVGSNASSIENEADFRKKCLELTEELDEDFVNNNETEGYDDASEEMAIESPMSLEEMLREGTKAFDIFINNQYFEGYELLDKYAPVSFYHSLGRAVVMSIRAILTLRKDFFPEAVEANERASAMINKYRKKRSTASRATSLLFKENYNNYTDEQCHAELVFAEMSAVNAAMSVVSDQTIKGFIKGAIRIRTCFQTYKQCQQIAKFKTNWANESTKKHFLSGVHLGIGLFDMAISYFPTKLIKLLEFAGFSGSRTCGLDELKKCEDITEGIRYPAISIALSGYYGFLEYFFGLGEPDVDCILRILNHWSVKAPDSIAVTFGCAFREQAKGNFEEACEYYTEFVHKQNVIKSFHFISNWQKMWIYAAQCDWKMATENAQFLMEKCKWSPAMFTYIYAAFASMLVEEEGRSDLRESVVDALRRVPKLKRTFGGRRAFHEKLVIERSKKFEDDVDSMLLAPLDLMYLWNVFQVASCEPSCLPRILGKIESKLMYFPKNENLDSYCYLTFMRGVCFSHSKCPLLAMECFLEVIDNEKQIQTETYLCPQACFEIGRIYRKMGDKVEAKKWLKKAKKYSNYLTEMMINFRAESALISMGK